MSLNRSLRSVNSTRCQLTLLMKISSLSALCIDELRRGDKLLCRMLKIDTYSQAVCFIKFHLSDDVPILLLKCISTSTLNQPIFLSANISYSTLSPNTITANTSSCIIHDIYRIIRKFSTVIKFSRLAESTKK